MLYTSSPAASGCVAAAVRSRRQAGGEVVIRIGQLSEASRVPLPTVKFYLREGLLPAGEPTGRNQAEYGPGHVSRLRLVRDLVEVGGLSVAAVRRVLSAVDDPGTPAADLIGTVHDRAPREPGRRRDSPDWRSARERLGRLAAERGWPAGPRAPILDQAADALAPLLALPAFDVTRMVQAYADLADLLADIETGALADGGNAVPDRADVVAAAVLGEALFGSLRGLAAGRVRAPSALGGCGGR